MKRQSKGFEFVCSLTCVCSHMPLQVEGIVKSFAAELTWMSLHQAVALEVAGQHALEGEYLVTDWTYEVTSARGSAGPRLEELVKTFSTGGSSVFFTFKPRKLISSVHSIDSTILHQTLSAWSLRLLTFAYIVTYCTETDVTLALLSASVLEWWE